MPETAIKPALHYRLLLVLLAPLLLGVFIWLQWRRGGRHFVWQRLGLCLRGLPQNALWFHCASVGEVMTALPLLHEIRHRQPELPLLITTNTATGARIVRQQGPDGAAHAFLPFDWAFATRRFLRRLRPRKLVVMETEIWPQLFYQCARAGCPVMLINARLSLKTSGAREWIRRLLRAALGNVRAIHARSSMDYEAWLALGAPAERVRLTGNLKVARSAPVIDSRQAPPPIARDYVLAASTHDNEEQQIARRWLALQRPELLLIAPRHPDRTAGILKQLHDLEDGLHIAVRSRGESPGERTDIFLLDTVGELIHYFAPARLVIMGGSFVPVGGHNLIEPASLGCCILCGAHMENFREELHLLRQAKAIYPLDDIDALGPCLERLLEDETLCRETGRRAQQAVDHFSHIIDDYADIVLADIDSPVQGSIKAAS